MSPETQEGDTYGSLHKNQFHCLSMGLPRLRSRNKGLEKLYVSKQPWLRGSDH